MKIRKSEGQTPTERLLSELCDRSFMKLWSYANIYKDDHKELCDLLAVFGGHIFIFFDRESRKFDDLNNDPYLTWDRWKKTAVDMQNQNCTWGCGLYPIWPFYIS